MSGLEDAKRAARAAALARRAEAHARGHPDPSGLLRAALAGLPGPVAAYVAMRTEIDPLPAIAGPVLLPVMADGPGRPLRFRLWDRAAPLVPGGFGTLVPPEGPWAAPRTLVVPLVAFDRRLNRLGYGGGFYDRTLAALRAAGHVTAVGFAWAAQEAEALPLEPTDAPLDAVVTESEAIGVVAARGGRC